MTQDALYLTPSQAAECLTEAGLPITEDTVRRWAREGKVPALKLPGGTYRIHRTDVLNLLATTGSVAA